MKILIADDESIIRMGLKSMLRELGHEVVTAVNGREALRMARSHKPDLAILDIKMPYTTGLEAAKVIGRTQPIPILILTAFSSNDLIEKASDLPIHGYLVKPVRKAELAAAIAVAIKRFAETKILAERTVKLSRKLDERKIVERAKGKLMETGLSEEVAYQTIQQRARKNRQTLKTAAKGIIGELE